MFKSVVRLALIAIVFFTKSVFASDINITSSESNPQTINLDSQQLTISDDGNLAVSNSSAVTVTGTEALITVNTNSSDNGISATQSSAINITETGSLQTLTLQNGLITSDVSNDGTIGIFSALNSGSYESTISLYEGTSLTNSTAGGYGIFYNSTDATTLTLNNAGTIGVVDDADSVAIKFSGSGGNSIFNLNNTSGIIDAGANGTAIAIDSSDDTVVIDNSGSGSIIGAINTGGSNTTISNNSGDGSTGITGNISATTGDLDINNNSAFITGNINLGTNTGSTLTIMDGSVLGNVTMGNADQVLTFSGSGALDGTIDGAGTIAVNDSTITNGNIGSTTALTTINIASGITLDANTNNNSINATNISIAGSNATLKMGTGALSGTVDGTAADTGKVTFFLDSTSATINSTLGSTNGLSLVSFTSTSGNTTLANNVKAQTVSVLGTTSTVSLASGKSITGAVSIGSGNTFTLNNGSSVSGDIKGASNGVGTIYLVDGSTVTSGGDFGTSSLGLAALNLSDFSNLTMASGKVINASAIGLSTVTSLTTSSYVTGNITLGNEAYLNLNDGAYVTGTIDGGSSGDGIINTSGLVVGLGQIGATNAISEINVASGSQARLGNSDSSYANIIKASNINITGQLDLLDATTITGNVTMIGASSKLNTSGYSQSISGNFTTASGSQIMMTVHSSSSADSIVAAGVATLDANTKLYVSLTSTAIGSTYTIVSGGTGSSLSAISDANINVNDSGTNKSGDYDFHTSVSGDSLILSVTSSVDTVTPTTFSNSTTQSIYSAIGSNPSGNLLTFKNYLESATEAEAAAATKSAAPQSDNSSNRNAVSVATASLTTSDSRVGEVLNSDNAQFAALKASDLQKKLGLTASAYGDTTEINHGMWVKAFASNASQSDSKTNGQGFKSNSGGFALGVDAKIDESAVVGLSFSTANSSIKSSDALKTTDVNTYQFNLYGGKIFGDYYANAILGYAANRYKSLRIIPSVSQNASAEYNGHTYVGMIKGGHNFTLAKGLRLSPEVTVTAANNNVNNYSENGAGSMNLQVKNSSTNFLETRVGMILDYTAVTSKKTKIRPALKLSYGYDWVGAKQNSTSNFVGQTSSFASQGSKVEKRSIKIGAGLDVFRIENIALGLEYTYEYRYNYFSNSGSLQARYSF